MLLNEYAFYYNEFEVTNLYIQQQVDMVDMVHTPHFSENTIYQRDILHYQLHMMAHNILGQLTDVL